MLGLEEEQRLETLSLHWNRCLLESNQLMQISENLGFDKKIINEFQLGYAHGFGDLSQQELEENGIIKNGANPMRGRLTIPLRGSTKQILGFQGRVLDLPGQSTSDHIAKYILTYNCQHFNRENYVFDSYNYGFIGTQVILTEGIKDAMKASLLGYRGLAILGSRVSKSQLEYLNKVFSSASKIFIAMDDDAAGERCVVEILNNFYRSYYGKISVIDHYCGYKDLAEYLENEDNASIAGLLLTSKPLDI
jgi:DNA primase